jgi:hypothetical protein
MIVNIHKRIAQLEDQILPKDEDYVTILWDLPGTEHFEVKIPLKDLSKEEQKSLFDKR